MSNWNQSRNSSASLTLLCDENCQSLILVDCCDSILLPFCLYSPLHTYTQTSGCLVNRLIVCTGTDLRVIKRSHRCFPATLVSVACITHHDEQVQPSAPSSFPHGSTQGPPTFVMSIFTLLHITGIHKQVGLKIHRVHQKAWRELAK